MIPHLSHQSNERQSKRLKTAHDAPLRTVPRSSQDDSDDIDELAAAGLGSVSVDLTQAGNRSMSHPVVTRITPARVPLDKLMDSSEYVRIAAADAKRNGSKKITRMVPRKSVSTAIDLTQNDAPPKPYQGTARSSGFVRGATDKNQGQRRAETGQQSEYFPKQWTGSNPTRAIRHPSPTGKRQPRGQSPQRNPSYTKRPVSVSSDELNRTLDVRKVGNKCVEQIDRESRQPSPTKELSRERDSSEESIVLEVGSSNIKPTCFTEHGRKGSTFNTHPKTQRPPTIIAFGLSMLIRGETYITAATAAQGLGVSFSDSRDSLDINRDQVNISKDNPSLQMPIGSLKRIWYNLESHRVRLEFARRSGQPCTHVCMELTSQRDVSKLLETLQQLVTEVNVEVVERVWMDKVFEKQLNEVSTIAKYSAKRTAYRDDITDKGVEIQAIKRRRMMRSSDTIGATSRCSEATAQDNPVISKSIYSNAKQEPAQDLCGPNETQNDVRRAKSTQPEKIDKLLLTIVKPPLPGSPAQSRRLKATNEPLNELDDSIRYSKVHGLGKKWKRPLIYPSSGRKKTTVDFDDLERLDDGQFLNDNLIGFYLRYLEQNFELKSPEKAKRVYWFNTYFFASLNHTSRGKRGINYEAVRKWTRGIDIFSYDYAVVPINEQAHWYVAIICNLRSLDRALEFGCGDLSRSPRLESVDDEEEVEEVLPALQLREITALQDDEEGKNNGSSGAEDARESLQELRLDGGTQEESTEKKVLRNAEDELLYNGNSSPNHHDTLESKEDTETIVVKPSISPNASSSQKKGKRMSIAPRARVFHPRQPAIITFDSLGLPHSSTTRALKDYLLEEAKDKRSMQLEDTQIKGITAKQIKQQDNYCDCGLFLLGYLEKFVEDPIAFVTKTLQREINTEKDWQQLNPSLLRVNMRELLQELHAEQENLRIGSKSKSPDIESDTATGKARATPLIEPHNSMTDATLEPVGSRNIPKRRGESRTSFTATAALRTRVEALEGSVTIPGPYSEYLTLDGAKDIVPYAYTADDSSRVIPDSQPEETPFRNQPDAHTAAALGAQEKPSTDQEPEIPSTPDRDVQETRFSDQESKSLSTPYRSRRKCKGAQVK